MNDLVPQSPQSQARVRRVLNVGSGAPGGGRLHPGFEDGAWREVRLDIDPAVNPDIVASVIDLKSVVADESFDAIWSSHSLEHLHTHEVIPALQEFRRVLRPGGRLMVLDFSTPTSKPLKALHDLFYFVVMPKVGRVVAWHRDAHHYTADSIRTWVSRDELNEAILEAGFVDGHYVSLSTWFGTVHFGASAAAA